MNLKSRIYLEGAYKNSYVQLKFYSGNYYPLPECSTGIETAEEKDIKRKNTFFFQHDMLGIATEMQNFR